MMFLWLQRKQKMGVATLNYYDQGLFLFFHFTRMILCSLIVRVWSIWAGWVCSKTCQREHLNLPLSTTREPCTKPGRSVSMYGRSFSKWGRSRQRCSLFFFFLFQVYGFHQNNRCLNCHLCSSLEVSEEVRQYLKTPTFDNWYDCKKPVCLIYHDDSTVACTVV